MRGAILILIGLGLAACRGQDEAAPTDSAVEQRVEANAPAASDLPPLETNIATSAGEAGRVSPCLMQGAERLQVSVIRAVGTEPFWGARVEGRCVTYSTPEDQQGTRLWTRYSEEPGGSRKWSGQLDGKPFEMLVRAEAGCSDGMSDTRYPLAVELLVNGERRRGCAQPL